MSIETEIVARLEADAGVGAIGGDRIFPNRLPDDTLMPAMSYEMADDTPGYDLQGELDRTIADIEISTWADTKAEAVDLAAAIRASLSGHNGLLTTLRATIKKTWHRDFFDDDAGEYRVRQDFSISYR